MKYVLGVLVLFMTFLGFMFEPETWMDLSRYNITYWDNLPVQTDIFQFIQHQFVAEFDFLYGLTFLIVKKLGLTVSCVNGLYVGLFYFSIFFIVTSLSKGFNVSKTNVATILFFILFTPQPITVFSISRQVPAVCMLMWAFYFYFKRRNKLAIIFLIISLFYHIGNIIFILPISICVVYWKRIASFFEKVSNQESLFMMIKITLLLLVLSKIALPLLIDIVSYTQIFSLNERYVDAYLSDNARFSGIALSLGNMSTICQYIILFINLTLVRKHYFSWCVGFSFFVIMCLMFFNYEFVVRRYTMILTIPSALLLLQLYEVNNHRPYYSTGLVLISFATLMSNLFYPEYFRSFWGWILLV